MLLFLTALLVATSAFAAGSQCNWVKNAKFGDAARAAIVAKHNDYRSRIANGTAKYKGGKTLSSGKNVYALVMVTEFSEALSRITEKNGQH
ncbi:hypothetical protein Tcan_10125 [Toxocara canis]|uniref:SCP domain-containing protein n=1 Tax=Toxocara canis TaxID=6265 RepID=A0A0B2W594_TOXCA|nr:hypothetical protein Tcan_10125 [Toxocara canis]